MKLLLTPCDFGAAGKFPPRNQAAPLYKDKFYQNIHSDIEIPISIE
jgi:hypothetical protein